MEKIKKMILIHIISKTTSNFDYSNCDSNPRPLKFMSFSLLINQNILSDLQLQF